MDYGDHGDFARGACFYDVVNDDVEFFDWLECPKYIKTTLSQIVDGKWDPKPKMKVRCMVDIDITYSEAQEIRQAMIEAYNIREFSLEENKLAKQLLLEEGTAEQGEEMDFSSVDELVVKKLESIATDKNATNIDPKMLIQLYKSLKVDV
jgi:hypothetical protein